MGHGRLIIGFESIASILFAAFDTMVTGKATIITLGMREVHEIATTCGKVKFKPPLCRYYY